MATGKFIVALLMATSAAAFRTRSSRRKAQGEIDYLVTFGAPSVSRPGLTNRRGSGGCFPGQRFWTRDGEDLDTVVQLAYVAGYSHPQVDGYSLDVGRGTRTSMGCSLSNTDMPTGNSNNALHSGDVYLQAASNIDPFYTNMTTIAVKSSYLRDSAEVAQQVRELGWGLVGTAFDRGSFLGGPQVSHLVQHPNTLECILTFQGTDSWKQWLTDIWAVRSSYCGLSERVHRGFRNHLQRITTSSKWQSEIRPHLPHCAKIYVTGHSLGGAMASLYTACVQNAPQSDDDYGSIGWTKGVAKKLPVK